MALTFLSNPASQWYRAGTDFHCLDKATMAPASERGENPFFIQKFYDNFREREIGTT